MVGEGAPLSGGSDKTGGEPAKEGAGGSASTGAAMGAPDKAGNEAPDKVGSVSAPGPFRPPDPRRSLGDDGVPNGGGLTGKGAGEGGSWTNSKWSL